MPRPNQPRSIASEESLARRIAYEREAAGMSYEGLASRMSRAGCPIQPSGLYKIEKAGRRITVDELVALSQVFGVRVEELLLPPEAAAAREVTELLLAWNRAQDEAAHATQVEQESWEAVRAYVEQHPEVRESLEAILRKWSELYYESDDLGHAFRTAHKMWEFTGDPEWGDRARELLNARVEQKRGQ
jgi:transcriptional regulator with XRE-family HTH domain